MNLPGGHGKIMGFNMTNAEIYGIYNMGIHDSMETFSTSTGTAGNPLRSQGDIHSLEYIC